MNEATRIIKAIERGDKGAAEELLPLVYRELRALAAQKMAQEKPGQTLQATALVHEAYLRLLAGENQSWNSKGHFFRAAAEAMRRILIENARRKKSLKRGGDRQRIKLDESILIAPEEIPSGDLLALDEAIEKLMGRDGTKADLVKLRVFAGLTGKQAAEILGISESKACEDLAYARAWLRLEINRSRQD